MPGGFKRGDLLEQRGQIDHHAVADDGLDAGRRIPLGISLRTNFFSPMKTVWPALCPPW